LSVVVRLIGCALNIVSVTFLATLPQCLVTGAVHQISVEATLLRQFNRRY
jgi:hypothetical protein